MSGWGGEKERFWASRGSRARVWKRGSGGFRQVKSARRRLLQYPVWVAGVGERVVRPEGCTGKRASQRELPGTLPSCCRATGTSLAGGGNWARQGEPRGGGTWRGGCLGERGPKLSWPGSFWLVGLKQLVGPRLQYMRSRLMHFAVSRCTALYRAVHQRRIHSLQAAPEFPRGTLSSPPSIVHLLTFYFGLANQARFSQNQPPPAQGLHRYRKQGITKSTNMSFLSVQGSARDNATSTLDSVDM
ncbi:hypothetical protein IF2G_03257 [Cordyceps javanica]|nr:hypothetical protein IF2G_03257 [Cordyceps javanica]